MGRGDALTWENFKHTYFRAGEHRVHRINREPLIEVFGDGVASRVGLWLEVPANTQLPPEISRLIFLSSQVFDREGDTLLELVAQQESLHRTFYHFATAVANRLLNEKTSAVELVVSELACFSDLLKEHAALSVEREIGLIGELVFLRRLIVPRVSELLVSFSRREKIR